MEIEKKRELILNILVASESNSSTECVTACLSLMQLLLCAMKSKRTARNRIAGFLQDVIPRYNLDEFKIHFRMSRVTVEVIYQELSEIVLNYHTSGLTERCYGGGIKQIHLEEKLLVFLWFMINRDSYREISNLFGITESACCNIVHRISKAFAEYLLPKAIRWPTMNEKIEISAAIHESKGFPNVMGMIDGCHIPVKMPSEGGVHYYNRKDFHSIILQAVCREDMRFTDVFIGFPGRVHDARVFDASPLFLHGAAMCGNYLLLGDSAYPNLGWLLTPYRETQILTPNMIRYNRVHSSIRTTIERAFGLLKGRFRRLKFIEQHTAETMSFTTAAACCLHNICILQDDTGDYFENDDSVPVSILPPGIFNNDARERGILRRNAIMQRLSRN